MSIIDAFISLVAPHDCLGCSRQGTLLCHDCCQSLPRLTASCYRCKQPSKQAYTCRDCMTQTKLIKVDVAVAYQGIAKDLLWRLKSNGAQAAVRSMVWCMMPLFAELRPNTLIVPIPTASSRARQRGYDQAVLLARAIAQKTGMPLSQCLGRGGQAHQVGANRKQRIVQLQGAFRLKSSLIVGRRVLLVDDVLTTGATLESAASVLYAGGAASVQAVAFAQPRLRHTPAP